MNITNNTNFKCFDEIKGKNSSKIYLREIEKKGILHYKLSKTNCPTLKKMEHFFKRIFSGNTVQYWHGKEKVMKQCEKNQWNFGKEEEVPVIPEEQPPIDEEIQAVAIPQISTPPKMDTSYPGFEKYYMNYSFQLVGNQFLSSIGALNWYDKVLGYKNGASLYLGALPLKPGTLREQDGEIYKDFKSKGIGAVLSVVEPFENHSVGYLHSAVTPEDWKKHGIDQMQLPAEDYGTMPLEDIEKGVEYIRRNVKKGKSVYVHCKAGKARSLLVVICYLIKYHGMTVDQALAYVKVRRTQAGFGTGSKKTEAAEAFYAKWGAKARPQV